MSKLTPDKLHVRLELAVPREMGELQPRCYTLTHSDTTGELFLTIGTHFDRAQISGWYTRVMRDEVLAEWVEVSGGYELRLYCHVSGGVVVGTTGWRLAIFRQHMPLVLEALRYGDRVLYQSFPALDLARVKVHFSARQAKYNLVEDWGEICKYQI